jgi:hypothetical protein
LFLSSRNMIRIIRPGYGSWFLPIPDTGSRGQQGNGSWIPNTDPQHCKIWYRKAFLILLKEVENKILSRQNLLFFMTRSRIYVAQYM